MTSPSIQFKPLCLPPSKPDVAISCKPIHIPKIGFAFTKTASSKASLSPSIPVNFLIQDSKAPTPGKTILSDFIISSGSLVRLTEPFSLDSLIASSIAFVAE